MKIPEEIKKKESVDEIDLQILVKEIKEREREKGNNNNLVHHEIEKKEPNQNMIKIVKMLLIN